MPRPPRLILNADDLGIHPAIDAGIREAFEDGVLSSATLLVTTPYAERAASMSCEIDLPTGLHLALTLGSPVSDAIELPDLVDEEGRFHRTARELLFLGERREATRDIYAQIEREFDAQFARACDLGVTLTHADSHQHVHMNPVIHGLVETISPRYGVTCLRFSREPFNWTPFLANALANARRRNPIKRVALNSLAQRIAPQLGHPDHFFGVGHSGSLGVRALERYVRAVRPGSTVEIGLHPGHPVPPADSPYERQGITEFITDEARGRELAGLRSETVRGAIAARGVEVISFGELVDG